MFVCKKLFTSFMLIIVLCGTVSDTFCMTSWAGSAWQNIKESPYTPYALSPAASYLGYKAMNLTCDAGFGILNQFDKQLHPGIYIPLAVGVAGAGIAAATLPSFALTEMIRKQRERYLLTGNLSSLQFYYPAIIQGLTLGLPFAYYLIKKESPISSTIAATMLAFIAASPGLIAGGLSEKKEEQRKSEKRQERLREIQERLEAIRDSQELRHRVEEERARQQEVIRQRIEQQNQSSSEAAPAA
jgi:hypothetical protein